MIVDLEELTADDLQHLAAIRRERERRAAETKAGRIAEVMWKPALGAYRTKKP